MSRAVEQDILQKFEDTRDSILGGVKTWEDYLRLQARYEVLRTLIENERERLKNLETANNGERLDEDL